MIPYLILFIVIGMHFACLWKIFDKAGEDSWKGFVPIYNWVIWFKITEKPWWWVLILLVPGVNLLMLIIMHVELSKSFDLREQKDILLAIVAPFYVLPILAFKDEHRFVGPEDYSMGKKSTLKEWGDAIIFAVIAATIIRTFFLEAFTIPTPSMEKSMLVGDYLFVSKMSYGPKLPNTPVSFPFTHHTLPLTKSTPSYVEWFKLPYFRLPGFGGIKRNDVVVFNFPEGDTVVADMQSQSYYAIVRNEAYQLGRNDENFEANRDKYFAQARQLLAQRKKILVRPIDKKENYIKRCVGVPGDNLEVKDNQLFINGKLAEKPEKMQYNYEIKANASFNKDLLKKQYDVTSGDIYEFGDKYIMPLTQKNATTLEEKFRNIQEIKASNRKKLPLGQYYPGSYLSYFPNDPKYNWTEDNFGPLYIPEEGKTIDLNIENLPLYRRIIDVYENNDLRVEGSKIFINGTEANSYTFKMNYYFLMGDNRHNSADSRFWGFVPENHVVGKAVFVWFSVDPDTGIRWKRLFSFVR